MRSLSNNPLAFSPPPVLAAALAAIVWALLLLMPAGPVAAASEAVVQSYLINLRAAPDSGSRVVAVLEKGARVAVLAREDGWLKVRYEDHEGYLRDRPRYVLVDEAASTPVGKKRAGGEDGDRQIAPRAPEKLAQPEKPAKAATPAKPRLTGREREYAGVIYPLHDISLSMGVSGLVSSIKVKLGDAVRQGQLLLQLDDAAEEIEAQRRLVIFNNRAELKSLEERILRTKTLMEDIRQLYEESGSVSLEEVFRTELDYFTLQGRYEQLTADKARERLEHLSAQQDRKMRRLNAPISGFITVLGVDEGEWVTPGSALAQLVDTSSGILRLAVPESAARQLQTGKRVPIRFDAYPEAGLAYGEVTFVSAAADPASGLVKMEITFDNRRLGIRPGGKGYAFLPAAGNRQ